MRPLLTVLLALAMVTAGCGGGTNGEVGLAISNVGRAETSLADAQAAATGINAFGLELFRSMGLAGENAVVSPASIALALGMARAGARGVTASEMDAVLRGVASDEHAAWLNALDRALATRSGDFTDANGDTQELTLRIANAPFAQDGMRLEQAFLDALAARYGAGLRLVDYATETEAARRLINGWVDDQTEGRIPDLLAPGVLTAATRLTLVNAIYLKAPWAQPFLEDATAPGPFTRADGSTVQLPMMATSERFRYADGGGWRAVDLPYAGDALAMTVIVPDDLPVFLDALDAAALSTIVGALSEHQVDLRLPKFSIETKASLAAVLRAMGMPSAFDGGADFSGITTEEALFIADVIHQANIDVDEAGTEAAAATAVVMEASLAPEPVTLHVDHPFLFALRDLETGAVLFLGQVTDPSQTAAA